MDARQRLRHWSRLKPWQWGVLLLLGVGLSVALTTSTSMMHSLMTQISWQGGMAILVTIVTFGLNAFTSLSPVVVFLGGLSVLLLSGVLTTQDALAGFSNDGMVTVGILYIVVTGLQQTGSLDWIAHQVLGTPKGLNPALARLLAPVIGLSAFLNNTPVVAMFVPVVNDWARKLRLSPSKFMIPLSYGAIFGGMLTLIGTSTNLVVNGLLISETDLPGVGMFDITRVSLPCVLLGVFYLFTFNRWLLPERKPAISDHDDPRQYTVEMVVEANSPLAGKSIEQAGLRHLPGLFLTEIVRSDRILPAVSPLEKLRANDQLVFVGVIDSILDLQRLRGLKPATDQVFKLDAPRTERCLVEAVVSNSCPLVGQTIREGQFRSRYNAVVLAVARNGERVTGKIGDIQLRSGDALLLEAPPSFLEQQRVSRDFYLVSEIPDSQPMRHDQAPVAIAILILMVLLAAFGIMSMLKAASLAAMLMLITRCCSAERALRSIEWDVLLVIGAALGLGRALDVTGAAQTIATSLIGVAGNEPWIALAVVYGITTLMTEIITNNAAAALVFPIALAVSRDLGVSFMPFVIAIMIGASASFSTPIGYQTNLMVYGPGGYKFTDFMRIGIPLNLMFWLVTVLITPLIFAF